MRSVLYKKCISLILLAGCLLLSASQTALAVKPVKSPPVVINAAIMDFSLSKILVTGSGLTNVNTVALGGVDIPSGEINKIDDNNLELPFTSTTALAVQRQGSYSLVVNGQAFSLYINSAIPDPGIVAVCPCAADWSSFGSTVPPAGFSGLTPSCADDLVTEGQVAVQFTDIENSNLWILTSEYNDAAKECALVFDATTRTLNSLQEHNACADFLRTSYINGNPTVPSCFP
jgi:hypothetical protein